MAELTYKNGRPFLHFTLTLFREPGIDEHIEFDYISKKYIVAGPDRQLDLRCDYDVSSRSPISRQIERSP